MRFEPIFAPNGVLPPVEEVFKPVPGGPNHDERRLLKRIEKRRRRSLEIGQVVTEALIPPGSLLSDEMLADIRAGKYRIARIHTPAKPQKAKKKYAV